jgi:hypothetical protein
VKAPIPKPEVRLVTDRFSSGLVTVGSSYDDNPTVNSSRLSLMRSA